MTNTGPDPGKECIFPFIYSETYKSQDRTYNACAYDYIGRPWCPTKLDDDGIFSTGLVENNNWGYCGYDCVLKDLPAGDIKTLFDYHVEVRNIIAFDYRIHYQSRANMTFRA